LVYAAYFFKTIQPILFALCSILFLVSNRRVALGRTAWFSSLLLLSWACDVSCRWWVGEILGIRWIWDGNELFYYKYKLQQIFSSDRESQTFQLHNSGQRNTGFFQLTFCSDGCIDASIIRLAESWRLKNRSRLRHYSHM